MGIGCAGFRTRDAGRGALLIKMDRTHSQQVPSASSGQALRPLTRSQDDSCYGVSPTVVDFADREMQGAAR